ncbi:hypothetical protein [Reichenbachiella sp.]|uniref:hypothetical protein n=1 Tax=Reichenbachiella sp. TaxID=2184521 RepID=UPI003B5C9E75
MKNDLKIIERYRDLKEDPFFPFSDEILERYSHTTESARIQANRNLFDQCLTQIENVNVTIVNYIRDGVLTAIAKINSLIEPNNKGNRVSRNQGLIIENALISKIIRVLNIALKSGYVVHSEFYYSIDDNDHINETELNDILTKHRENIQGKTYDSFTELEDDVENLIIELSNGFPRFQS